MDGSELVFNYPASTTNSVNQSSSSSSASPIVKPYAALGSQDVYISSQGKKKPQGVREAITNFGKGIVKGAYNAVASLFTLQGMAMAVGSLILIAAAPAVGIPLLLSAGVVIGGKQIAEGATTGNWEKAGEGTFTLGATMLGAKFGPKTIRSGDTKYSFVSTSSKDGITTVSKPTGILGNTWANIKGLFGGKMAKLDKNGNIMTTVDGKLVEGKNIYQLTKEKFSNKDEKGSDNSVNADTTSVALNKNISSNSAVEKAIREQVQPTFPKPELNQAEPTKVTNSRNPELSPTSEIYKPKPWWNDGLYRPFSVEAKQLKLEEVEDFLKDHPKFFEEKDTRHGISNIHYVARDNTDPRVLEALLDRVSSNKQIDVTTNNGSTLLHYATNNANPEVVRILLSRKPELIKERGHLGTSAIETAAEDAPNAKVMEYLLNTPGSTEVLKGSGNVWRSDNRPSDALHRVIENYKLSDEDCIKMIKLLAKADPRMLNAENSAELTPLELAEKKLANGKKDKVIKAFKELEQETGQSIAKTPWWKKSSSSLSKDISHPDMFKNYAEKLKFDELEPFLKDYPGKKGVMESQAYIILPRKTGIQKY